MWNPYQYDRSASAQAQTRLLDCYDCGKLFEPLCPWDLYCESCWATRQEADVEALAEREGE